MYERTIVDRDSDIESSVPLVGQIKSKEIGKVRLMSLDVLRGVTIAMMIFVDFCGQSTPAIDHAAWDGVRLADFVMPSFDFIVGVAFVMSMQSGRMKTSSQTIQLSNLLTRSVKLFILGMATQAGTAFPTYDLKHIRIMGILQRVSLCYFVCGFVEIVLPKPSTSEVNNKDILIRRKWHWLVSIGFVCLHSILLYGVDGGCGRGYLSPNCNAASYIDEKLLGIDHMYFPTNGGAYEYKEITFQRTSDCSSCSPGRCIPTSSEDVPSWCGYSSEKGGKPFDPEGLVSSLTAVVASLIGANFGFATLCLRRSKDRIKHWSALSFAMMVAGIILDQTGLRFNTDLYSLSYLLLSTGVSGMMFALCYACVDMENCDDEVVVINKKSDVTYLLKPFHWLGLNSILIYMLSCSGITESALSCFYWGERDKNLAEMFYPTGKYWGPDGYDGYDRYHSVQVVCWCVFGYIPFWMILAGYLHKRKFYWKI